MIVATNTIRIKSGHVEEVAERFKSPKAVQHAPGFIRMELLAGKGEEHDELKVCTTWESREAFDGWVKSDAFRQAHGRPPAGGAAGGEAPSGHSHGGTAASSAAAAEPSHQDAAASPHRQGPSHGEGARRAPGAGIMLGAKLSVHEVLFTHGQEQ
ncbi:antibiotic biosynthesis monooxygenase [Paenibacillus sp. IB182496]|uniref:Antibiotic biosynthesis monooxygenase n=1 Tax=Paenibacillus sabuli TaxID=2772509 RepID=A0A927BSV3_9BACL|nr:antibiotic biosynthesis monooxygenase [Paenibacillus sabuli]MBD2844808.1 antibiotic biosynthesis monooxygenase [Paenibacillus sabuli]